MTDTTEKPKPKPNYYIFEKDADGNNLRVGAVFKHNKGDGFNIVIDNKRYAAFPPKPKP